MTYKRNDAGPVLRLRNRLYGLAVVVLPPERGGRNLKGGLSGHNGPSVREALDETPGSSLHADGIGKGSLPFLHCDNCGWTLTEDAVNSPSWQRLLEKWT